MGATGAGLRASGGAFRLFLTLGWLAVIGIAFALGYQLAYHDADNALIELRQLENDRRGLQEALMAAEERVAGLERAQSIDREAKRLAQAQLEELQHERHEYAKQVSALERLIREGGGGVAQLQDFGLWETKQPREFGYRFTVAQLISEFGETSGRVELQVEGKTRQGESVTRTAAQLDGSNPGVHHMEFEYFQNFSGVLRLPEDFEPLSLTIEIEPSVKNLISSAQTYTWKPDAWQPEAIQPVVSESINGAADE